MFSTVCTVVPENQRSKWRVDCLVAYAFREKAKPLLTKSTKPSHKTKRLLSFALIPAHLNTPQELLASVRKGRPIITVQVSFRGREPFRESPPLPRTSHTTPPRLAICASLRRHSAGGDPQDLTRCWQSSIIGYGELGSPIKPSGGKAPVLSPPPRSPTGRPSRAGGLPPSYPVKLLPPNLYRPFDPSQTSAVV